MTPLSKTWPSALAAAAVLCACGPQEQLGRRAALEEQKPVEEAAPTPPPFPKAENLARIETGAAGSFDVFVDTASVQVMGKGEYRYTVVAKTGSASNVSFEGLRCLARERRVYALGRADGSWAPVRKSEWTSYSRTRSGEISIILAEEYFCPDYLPLVSVEEAVQALRYGRRPRAP